MFSDGPRPLHLTFDDGPDPVGTPLVLEALGRARARATFFVLGPAVREHPQLVDRVLQAGHRIELHGERHLDHRCTDAAALEFDTVSGIEAIERATGITPTWWRIPWGRPGPATAAVAEEHALRIAGWDADTHDWRGDGWADQGAHVRAAARDGGVVLLHDGLGPGATRSGFAAGLGILERLLAEAAAHGRAVAPLPDADELAAHAIPARAAAERPSPHDDLHDDLETAA